MKFCKAELGDWGARATLTIAALMVMAASANAQQLPHSLRDALLGHKGPAEARRVAAPPVARYVSEAGGGFIFDQAAPQPLMKFDNSTEIWVLSPQPASRGDVIYRNDLGEPVLRVTKLGGMILFTDDAPMGAAAALSGRASSIQPPAIMARKGDRSLISRIFRVLLAEGRKPSAALKDGALTIFYSPDQGLAGRPSSKRIIKVLNR